MLKRHSFVITLLIYPANHLALSCFPFSRSDELPFFIHCPLEYIAIVKMPKRVILILHFHKVTNRVTSIRLAFSQSDESLNTLFNIQRSACAVLFLHFHEVTNMFGKYFPINYNLIKMPTFLCN